MMKRIFALVVMMLSICSLLNATQVKGRGKSQSLFRRENNLQGEVAQNFNNLAAARSTTYPVVGNCRNCPSSRDYTKNLFDGAF